MTATCLFRINLLKVFMASDDSELQGKDLIRFFNFTGFVWLKGLKTTLLKTSLFSCRYYEYTDWRPNDGKQYKWKPPPTTSCKIFGLGRSLRYQGYWSVPSMVLPPAAGSQPGRFSKNLLLPHLNSCKDCQPRVPSTKYSLPRVLGAPIDSGAPTCWYPVGQPPARALL